MGHVDLISQEFQYGGMSTPKTVYGFSSTSKFHCMIKSTIFEGILQQRQEALDGYLERNQSVSKEEHEFQNVEESILQRILAFLNNHKCKAEREFIVFSPKQLQERNSPIATFVENITHVILVKHQFEHREQSEGKTHWRSGIIMIPTQ